MNKYTIYCTKEQTERAYKLSAPIGSCGYYYKQQVGCETISDTDLRIIPTAEQMCGWLREKGLNAYADCTYEDSYYGSVYDMECEDLEQIDGFDNYGDAIRAAIDAALDYLEKEGGEE